MMKNRIKNILFLFLLVMLITPLVLMRYPFIKEKLLFGHFTTSSKPDSKKWTWAGWFSGSFQEEFSAGFNDNAGLRMTMIRINNQYDYSLFGIIHAEGFIAGKNGYLYEEDYIKEYTGKYFIGKKVLDRKMDKLFDVQRMLRERGIDLILVLEPGKASYYPEYIPNRYHPEKSTLSNYTYLTSKLMERGMDYLDLSHWFLELKDTSRYNLFPRYGMHWSIYGMNLALDTLSRYISSVSGKKLPGFTMRNIELSATPRSTDNDIEEMANLLFPMPDDTYAYPVNIFGDDTSRRNLNVLVVGDSYYRNIKDDFSGFLFKADTFWYYNSKVYPHIHTKVVYVDHSNLLKTLEQYQVIILMVSEINLHCTFWNFIDQAYAALHPGYHDSYIYNKENEIRNERSWFRFMVGKAFRESRPLERVITADATYLMNLNYDSIKDKTAEDSIARVVWTIKSKPDWYAQVVKKAKERNIPIEQMLNRDALFIYKSMKKQGGNK
jgi:hypothetical protein